VTEASLLRTLPICATKLLVMTLLLGVVALEP
jgi:hypothetical protein